MLYQRQSFFGEKDFAMAVQPAARIKFQIIETDLEKTRSSHQRYSIKKGVLRNFTKFTGKHLC